jgi:ubiquinone/menaquinone biosynthesis C-methylase UbiE
LDRVRFSTLAHRDHRFLGPVDPDGLERMFANLVLQPSDEVLDIGFGKGEMLIRLIERFGVSGVGVDPNSAFLDEAKSEATVRGVAPRLVLHHARYADVPLPPERFAMAIAAGAGAAFDGYRDALRKLRSHVRVGGYVLIGEGYWLREPDPAYLAALEATRDEMTDLASTVSAGTEVGLTPLQVAVSTEVDWDRYEDLYQRGIEDYARTHPGDPDRDAMLERIRAWQSTYRKWGRDTLGFALILYRRL